jgi:hypothetical protein
MILLGKDNRYTLRDHREAFSRRLSSATTYRWDDRNVASRGNATRKPTCELNVLIPDENIYVLSNQSLLGENAISQIRRLRA